MQPLFLLLYCKFCSESLASCQRVPIPMLRVSGVVVVSVAQEVTITPVGNVDVVEGTILTITCTDGSSIGSILSLRRNGVSLVGDDVPPNEVNGTVRIFRLPVNRTQDGDMYDCQSVLTATVSQVITLSVACKWNWLELILSR